MNIVEFVTTIIITRHVFPTADMVISFTHNIHEELFIPWTNGDESNRMSHISRMQFYNLNISSTTLNVRLSDYNILGPRLLLNENAFYNARCSNGLYMLGI